MGRTNQPLRLLVHPLLEKHPSIEKLVEKGHIVETAESGDRDLSRYDLVIGPNCWRMDESLLEEKLLEVALKASRAEKKKREAK